jgi:hypothetical protein
MTSRALQRSSLPRIALQRPGVLAKVAGHCGASVPVSVHARCPQNICGSEVVRGRSVPPVAAAACSYARMPPPRTPEDNSARSYSAIHHKNSSDVVTRTPSPCMLETVAIMLFMTQKKCIIVAIYQFVVDLFSFS